MSAAEPEVPQEALTERSIPPLPAIDTSPESWRFVASAFVVECLLWGQVFSSGIFLKHLATRPVSPGVLYLSTEVRLKILSLHSL